VKEYLQQSKTVAQLDCDDLMTFEDALKDRMSDEAKRVAQLNEFIASIKKSIIISQKHRDDVKKRAVVSRK